MSYLQNQQHYPSPMKRQFSPIKTTQSQYLNTILTPPQNITQKKYFNQQQQQQLLQHISPNKITEAELWKSRCDQLETSLCQINTDLELEKFKAKNAKELESRIELILKQNSQILSENDALNKNLQQKKTESDIWKNKYENQMNTIIALKANYELDAKKTHQENQKLKQIVESLSGDKFREVEDTKGKMFQEGNDKIEILKRTHHKNTSLYEEQIRKMKDIIDEREKEIYELSHKLAYIRNDGESECLRLNDDREKLRMRIQQLELDLQREVELQKNKLDHQFNEQIQSIKYLHHQEMETIETELKKLKKLLDSKNEEIQILINQNKSQKNNFDFENQDLKIEIQTLKEKLHENNVIKDHEINDLKEKLVILHTTDIYELKNRHEHTENNFQSEIEKYKHLLAQKTEELENEMREKNNQRYSYNQETDRLKNEIENIRFRYQNLEKEKEKQAYESAALLERTNQTHDNFSNQLKNQIAFLEQEIDLLKFNLVKKNNEIDENNVKHNALKNALEEELRITKYDNEQWKKQYQALEYSKDKIIDDNKHTFQINEGQLQDKIRKLEGIQDFKQNELNKAEEHIQLLKEEYNILINQKQYDELEIQKLKQEIDQLGDQVIFLEKLKAKEQEEQRIQQENQNEYAIQTLKISQLNNEKILQDQINNLKAIITQRDQKIDDMIDKYNSLEDAFSEFQANADKLQDYEKRIQLLGAEIVTTKNLYDVFVRTKSRFTKK